MEKQIKISKIKIQQNSGKVKVGCKVQSDKPDYDLWFEIEKKYEKYVLYEKADAFLIAILPYAIKKELDIYIDGKISTRLYYQLSTYLIPMLCNKFNKKIIKINTDLDNNNYNIENAVGTGISCGIDSLYTIQKHSALREKEYNVTHLTFFNAGASGEYGGEKARKLYKDRMKFTKKFAEDNNFEFVCVDSNMNEFLMMNHEKTHTFRSLACVLILQKLFSKYYYSSGVDFDETCIDEYDTACYDILNMQCLSTEDITFYSTGMEVNRIGKVKQISEYKPSYNTLNVCVAEEFNCGKCEKCIRTLLELDSINKLKLYEKVFDLESFEKNKNKYLSFMLKKAREKNVFYIEISDEYKKNKYKIPTYVRIISIIPNKQQIKKIIFKFISKEKIKKILRKENINDGWTD